LDKHQIVTSMSGLANPWDNAKWVHSNLPNAESAATSSSVMA
jgi:hypothetical protein